MNRTRSPRAAPGLAHPGLLWFLALGLVVGSWTLGRRSMRAHPPARRHEPAPPVLSPEEEAARALESAASQGHPAAVRRLLAAGAALDAHDREGRTALALAVESQRWIDDNARPEPEQRDSPREPGPNYRAAARLLRAAGAAR